MNISNIKYFSTVNGDGVRTAVFVSGCRLHCKGCFNTEAWDFSYGHPLSNKLIDKILDSIDYPYIKGLSILGGEPLDTRNQQGVCELISKFRDRFADSKDIWLWTGYIYKGSIPETEYTDTILNNINTIVDGQYIDSLRNVNLKYRGSENQRIIKLK